MWKERLHYLVIYFLYMKMYPIWVVPKNRLEACLSVTILLILLVRMRKMLVRCHSAKVV